MSFCLSSQRIEDAKKFKSLYFSPLVFGNSYLDECLGGIYADDLVIVTARTGGGKTEMVTQIALMNCLLKKRVHYFALEAHPYEIEMRIKFKMLASAFFLQKDWHLNFRGYPNYQDWVYNRQEDILGKFEAEVDEEFKEKLATLNTFYRTGPFDADTFESHLHQIRETDLVILDHLHFFDFDSDNENQDLKRTVKQIKDVVSFYRIPVILVVQLRKQDKRTKDLLPDLEEIHGSSDIAKIATKIIATGPAKDQPRKNSYVFPTYFKALKNRTDGSRCYYTALCGYNSQQNMYSATYALGTQKFDSGQFVLTEPTQRPQWAKSLELVYEPS